MNTETSRRDLKDLRIVFMGTPEFAAASLEALLAVGCNVVAVVTAADKPAGRGLQIQQSAVKKLAVEKGLPVLQPEKLKAAEFIDELKSFRADVQAVVAFRMLPEVVWNMPPLGTINVHASLLPQYRGAAPINWAIINGETKTGVTTFKLTHEIDTGNILLQSEVDITEHDTAGTLHDKLKSEGAKLLVETLQSLCQGTLAEQPQPSGSAELRHAPKIFTETAQLNWSRPLGEVHNLVRGLSPYPAATAVLKDKPIKIFRTEKVFETPAIAPGEFRTDGKQFLDFAAADGFLRVKELQPAGKKRMTVEEFLRGFRP